MKLFRFRKKPKPSGYVRKSEDSGDLFSSEAAKQVIFDMLLGVILVGVLALIFAFVSERYFPKSLPYPEKDSVTINLFDEVLELIGLDDK